ncbi:hypothetical protein FOZ60_006985 [Perkinsus olseni]|uniref:Uncharacterized protein n=1 Tax=Perkinsus olseni TaxID=32597 RepID=A0A7J6NNN3_PEROL|nr:hypothetical protein FOZ60_006985 [Perkinsus olseni]
MNFVLSLITSTLLFVAVNAAPVGKYYGSTVTGTRFIIYIKEDNTVRVMYSFPKTVYSRTRSYPLHPGRVADEYIIKDNLKHPSCLRGLKGDCVLDDGDLVNLRFAADEDSLTTSVGGRIVKFRRIDNSFIVPYYSTPNENLKIEWVMHRYKTMVAHVTVNCTVRRLKSAGARNSLVNGEFPFQSKNYLSPYSMWPRPRKYYRDFKKELFTVCGIQLSPTDFKTITFATSTTAYTKFLGKRLTLTAL